MAFIIIIIIIVFISFNSKPNLSCYKVLFLWFYSTYLNDEANVMELVSSAEHAKFSCLVLHLRSWQHTWISGCGPVKMTF